MIQAQIEVKNLHQRNKYSNSWNYNLMTNKYFWNGKLKIISNTVLFIILFQSKGFEKKWITKLCFLNLDIKK